MIHIFLTKSDFESEVLYTMVKNSDDTHRPELLMKISVQKF